MRRIIVATAVFTLALWGNALLAQAQEKAEAKQQSRAQKQERIHVPGTAQGTPEQDRTATADQTQTQKRDRIHVPGTGEPATRQGTQAGQAQKGQNGKMAGPDGTGNMGTGPKDGTGYGSKSKQWPNQNPGGWGSQGNQRPGGSNTSGSAGRGRSGGRGRR